MLHSLFCSSRADRGYAGLHNSLLKTSCIGNYPCDMLVALQSLENLYGELKILITWEYKIETPSQSKVSSCTCTPDQGSRSVLKLKRVKSSSFHSVSATAHCV